MALGKFGVVLAADGAGLLARRSWRYTRSLKAATPEEHIRAYFHALYSTFGPQHWWPGRNRFEVVLGAYLVQNTGWVNVELALRRLRAAGALSLEGMRRIRISKLESLVRPAGYFRQKARNLKSFVTFLDEHYNGSLDRMFGQPTEKLRQQLLGLRGVGRETADSILLYAGQHPLFVVDAYARRILERHSLSSATDSYDNVRALFERSLIGETLPPPKGRATHPSGNRPSPISRAKRTPLAQVYNEMHGLVVAAGKKYCLKSQPHCDGCPLQPFLPSPKGRHRGI